MSHRPRDWDGKEPESGPPKWLKPRKSRRPHRLRKGWRWLRIGETVAIGDYCCDPRIMPVRIEVAGAWAMTDKHHPVQTPRALPKWALKRPIVRPRPSTLVRD